MATCAVLAAMGKSAMQRVGGMPTLGPVPVVWGYKPKTRVTMARQQRAAKKKRNKRK